MSKRKRKVREAEAVRELEDAIDHSQARARAELKTDKELFVLDTKGGKKGGTTLAPAPAPESGSKRRRRAGAAPGKVGKVKATSVARGRATQARLKGRRRGYDLWGRAELPDGERTKASTEGWDMTGVARPGRTQDRLWTHAAKISRNSAVVRRPSTKHKVKDVELPAPGQSYHPEFEEHQNALAGAVADEMQRLEREQEVGVANPTFEPSSHLLEHLVSSDDDDYEDNDDSDSEDAGNGVASMNSTKPQQKLTRAQRNKIARRKKAEWDAKQQKADKKLLRAIGAAPMFAAELKQHEKQRKKVRAQKQKWAEEKLEQRPVPKRGGKEVSDTPTEVALTEDLSGSMRLLKPEGQVAADRFASLLRRNRFEAGKQHAPGKKKGRFKLRERYRVGEKSTHYDRARIMALDARS